MRGKPENPLEHIEHIRDDIEKQENIKSKEKRPQKKQQSPEIKDIYDSLKRALNGEEIVVSVESLTSAEKKTLKTYNHIVQVEENKEKGIFILRPKEKENLESNEEMR